MEPGVSTDSSPYRPLTRFQRSREANPRGRRLDHRAMSGEVTAARAAIRISSARCRLLGLEGLDTQGSPRSRLQTVVVPPGD
jgi:hypothetical protein